MKQKTLLSLRTKKGEEDNGKIVFRDYAEVNESMMEGFTVAKVSTGINAEGSGMMLELERTIDNVTIGIDVVYNPDCEEGETPLMVSGEFVKQIYCQGKEGRHEIPH